MGMAKPLYVQAFEHFKNNHDDPLNAYVAFGLYVDAEYKWAEAQQNWPTDRKYKDWYDCSVPHSAATHYEKATEVLQEFANNIVEQERADFLQAALDSFLEEAGKAEKGFWRGVAEAVTGALIYSGILIVASIIAQRQGIDLVEIYGRLAGHH